MARVACAAAVVAVLAVAVQRALFTSTAPSLWLRLGVLASVCAITIAVIPRLPDRARHLPVTGFALLAGALFVAYVGAATAFATLLLAACAISLAPISEFPGRPPGLLVGLALIAGTVGWLLPFPVHGSRIYLALALGISVLRRRNLAVSVAAAAREYQRIAHTAAPWLMVTTVAVAVAGLGLWLPSMNYDDNAAHLVLPTQLLRDGWYHLDVSTQVWAVAPWANNVLAGIAGMFAGGDARAAVNLAWLVLGADGARRLALALGGDDRIGMASAAVFAATPLTGYFTTSLQVDGASAAVLLQFAAMLARGGDRLPPALATGAILGLLAGLKAPNAVYAAPAIAWLAWLAARQRDGRWLAKAGGLAALLGGSSYAYAWLVTGNPLFPLFNGIFQSAYLPAEDFVDTRWLSGMGWDAPWQLTFASGRYGEVYPGAFGLAFLALLPAAAWLAVRRRAAAAMFAWFMLAGVFLFMQVQYLRYVFPAAAVITVLGVVGLASALPRFAWRTLLGALVVANLALAGTTSWMLRDDPFATLLREGPLARAEIEKRVIPQKVLVRHLELGRPGACVLVADPASPFGAAIAGRATVVNSTYDRRMARTYEWANGDPTGQRWQKVLSTMGTTDVITGPSPAAGLRAGMEALGFEERQTLGEGIAWAAPRDRRPDCEDGVLRMRDEARRRLRPTWGAP